MHGMQKIEEDKFAEAYGTLQQVYCHLVEATIAVVMFGAMCRHEDASGLMWRNIRFEADGSASRLLSTSARTASTTKATRYW